jgi:hypothetical protein
MTRSKALQLQPDQQTLHGANGAAELLVNPSIDDKSVRFRTKLYSKASGALTLWRGRSLERAGDLPGQPRAGDRETTCRTYRHGQADLADNLTKPAANPDKARD